MPRRLMAIVGALAVMAIGATGSAVAQTLQNVLERGTLVVGVKADYRPWGFRDENGNICRSVSSACCRRG